MPDDFGADTDIMGRRAFDRFTEDGKRISTAVRQGIQANPLPTDVDPKGPDAAIALLPDPTIVADFTYVLAVMPQKAQRAMNDVGAKFAQIEEINAELGSTVSDTSITRH